MSKLYSELITEEAEVKLVPRRRSRHDTGDSSVFELQVTFKNLPSDMRASMTEALVLALDEELVEN